MNNASFIFEPVIPMVFATVVCLAVLACLIWFEYRKPIKWRRLRIGAAVLVTLGLFGAITRPSLRTTEQANRILVTNNTDALVSDSLQRQTEGSVAINVRDVHGNSLENLRDNIRFVVGDGLDPSDLELMRGSKFEFIKSKPANGIIRLTIPEERFANQRISISGMINTDKTTKITLESPAGKLDSTSVKTGLHSFTLSFTPKTAGKLLYTISDGATTDSLPIVIQPARKLKILIVEDFPTFELKYLKNFLSEHHEVVTRYQMSRDKFRMEYANTQQQAFSRLNESTLQQFDVLVMNFDVAGGLSSQEVLAIRKELLRGLGVLLLATDQVNNNVKSLTGVNFVSFPRDTAMITLSLKQFNLATANLKTTDEIDAVVKNRSRVLAGVKTERLGHVGIQFLSQTFQLQLQGDTLVYSELWSKLIQKTVRANLHGNDLLLRSFPLYVDEPQVATIMTTADSPPAVFLDSIKLPVSENFYVDNMYRLRFRVHEPGWHSLRIEGDSSMHHFFAFSKNSWNGIRRANTQEETSMLASTATFSQKAFIAYNRISPLVFYVPMILGMTILWLTPKI